MFESLDSYYCGYAHLFDLSLMHFADPAHDNFSQRLHGARTDLWSDASGIERRRQSFSM